MTGTSNETPGLGAASDPTPNERCTPADRWLPLPPSVLRSVLYSLSTLAREADHLQAWSGTKSGDDDSYTLRLRFGNERATIDVTWQVGQALCCDMHNTNCEPPSELCCHSCTERAHDTFPIRHADGSVCVLAEPGQETRR